jgi:hypothetical protein
MSKLKMSETWHDLHDTRNGSSEPLAADRAVVAFRMILFVGGMAVLASIPRAGDSKNNFALRLLDRIQGQNPIHLTEVAETNSADARPHPLTLNAGLTIQPLTEPSPASSKALPLKGLLVQEFWRSIISSSVLERYNSYLTKYPSGTFADLATARLKDLRNVTSEFSVDIRVDGTPRNPENLTPSKAVKRKTSAKALAVKPSPSTARGRCWSGNIDGCKERCRAGEIRACQKIRRLGD